MAEPAGRREGGNDGERGKERRPRGQFRRRGGTGSLGLEAVGAEQPGVPELGGGRLPEALGPRQAEVRAESGRGADAAGVEDVAGGAVDAPPLHEQPPRLRARRGRGGAAALLLFLALQLLHEDHAVGRGRGPGVPPLPDVGPALRVRRVPLEPQRGRSPAVGEDVDQEWGLPDVPHDLDIRGFQNGSTGRDIAWRAKSWSSRGSTYLEDGLLHPLVQLLRRHGIAPGSSAAAPQHLPLDPPRRAVSIVDESPAGTWFPGEDTATGCEVHRSLGGGERHGREGGGPIGAPLSSSRRRGGRPRMQEALVFAAADRKIGGGGGRHALETAVPSLSIYLSVG